MQRIIQKKMNQMGGDDPIDVQAINLGISWKERGVVNCDK